MFAGEFGTGGLGGRSNVYLPTRPGSPGSARRRRSVRGECPTASKKSLPMAPLQKTDLLAGVLEAALDSAPISLGGRRTLTPHEFYRYPARFSPRLAAAAIAAFTEPGDLVADYFVGGGTTLVEARRLGRPVIGSDINSLSVFVSNVKTRLYSEFELAAVAQWAEAVELEQSGVTGLPLDPTLLGYFRNMESEELSGQRRVVLSAVASLEGIRSAKARDLARCVLLRTGQWAFDMRREVPEPPQFLDALIENSWAMTTVAHQITEEYRLAETGASNLPACVVLHQGLPGVADRPELADHPAPRLILTSPPYPGVYVNYHRWKLRGRLETSFPYFLAGQEDGNGLAYYTMSARADRTQQTYFRKLEEAFSDVARVCDQQTQLVQVVGFNNVDAQLEQYLLAMESAGFSEVRYTALATAEDGRLWRDVPGRRWWAHVGDRADVATHTAREVILIHRLSSDGPKH
jgi:DNA modification methylase